MIQSKTQRLGMGLEDRRKIGENSQISRFGKICGKLTLFQKYLAINHFFSTQVPRCVASMALLTWKLCN